MSDNSAKALRTALTLIEEGKSPEKPSAYMHGLLNATSSYIELLEAENKQLKMDKQNLGEGKPYPKAQVDALIDAVELATFAVGQKAVLRAIADLRGEG